MNKVSVNRMKNKFELDLNLTPVTLNKLCTALKCQPGDLLRYTPDGLPKKRGEKTVMIIFRITETMARYKVSVVALSKELGTSDSAVSKWRQGRATPSFERLDQIMDALAKIGDPKQLELHPLRLPELLEWREEKPVKLEQDDRS